jgi:tungstate transport system permease protein
MEIFLDAIISAMLLIINFDKEVFEIVAVSLKVSVASTFISSAFGIPLGFIIAFNSFRFKRLLITCLNTLLALPTVVIGLFVYSFISRRGILGSLDLLYTQKAIIIGQVILIIPLVTTLCIAAINKIDERYGKTAMTLGAERWQTAFIILKETKYGIIAAVIAAFGRVIAEVGISMMLGGNAKGFTRTITTAMALEYDKGEFVLSLALGIILLIIAFGINIFFHLCQGRSEK